VIELIVMMSIAWWWGKWHDPREIAIRHHKARYQQHVPPIGPGPFHQQAHRKG
jgi:hypothetical protein